MQKKTLSPDNISYAATITACQKSNAWEPALLLLERMQHVRLEPDIIAYTNAIWACESSSRALSLFSTMKKAAIQPSAIAYDALISTCSWPLALLSFLFLSFPFLSFPFFSFPFLSFPFWPLALALFEEMRLSGIQPNCISYSRFMGDCEWQVALKFFEHATLQSSVDAITYKVILNSLALASKFDLAIRIYRLGLRSQLCESLWRAPFKADFHGLSSEQATIGLMLILEDIQFAPVLQTLTLVCGRGLGSKDGRSVLRPHLLHMLESFGLGGKIPRGYAAGRINVSAKSLEAWRRKRCVS